MRRIFLIWTALLVAVLLHAQNETSVLDKSAATLRAEGNVKIGFTLEVDGGASAGYIKLQRQKFVVNVGGSITGFDGKTMWTYVKANEEVNVTNPSADAVAKMNPYAFLSFYKKGYTVKMGKGTAKEHEVLLTGKSGSPYTNVVMRINKSTQYPTFIKMTSSKGAVTTMRCNSFLKNQKYKDSTFQFNKKNYPDAEIVDLR